jgi:hypothetical protein
MRIGLDAHATGANQGSVAAPWPGRDHRAIGGPPVDSPRVNELRLAVGEGTRLVTFVPGGLAGQKASLSAEVRKRRGA